MNPKNHTIDELGDEILRIERQKAWERRAPIRMAVEIFSNLFTLFILYLIWTSIGYVSQIKDQVATTAATITRLEEKSREQLVLLNQLRNDLNALEERHQEKGKP